MSDETAARARQSPVRRHVHPEVRAIGERVIAEHQHALRRFEAYDRGEVTLPSHPQRHQSIPGNQVEYYVTILRCAECRSDYVPLDVDELLRCQRCDHRLRHPGLPITPSNAVTSDWLLTCSESARRAFRNEVERTAFHVWKRWRLERWRREQRPMRGHRRH